MKKADKLITRVGKVLSEAKRGGFSIVLNYEPENEPDVNKGALYFAIEITADIPSATDLAYNLIETIKEEYYKRADEKPAISFERALKVANEELKELAKDGDKSWLGHLNIIVASIHSNRLILVHRGTVEAHLLRKGKIIHITEDLYSPGENYKPEETLINILDGEVEVGDKLVLSTAELFYYFSLDQVRRLIDNYTPAEATKRIAERLREEDDVNRTGILVIEFSLPELLLVEEVGKESSEIWVNAPQPTPKINRFEQKAPIVEVSDEDEEEEETEDEEDYEDEFEEETKNVKPRPSFQMPKLNVKPIDLSNVKFGSKAMQEVWNFIHWAGILIWRILKGIGKILLTLVDWLLGIVTVQVARIKKQKNGDKILLAIVVIIVVALVGSSYALVQGGRNLIGGKSATRSLNEAQQKVNDAEAALIYEDNAKAMTLLTDSLKLAETAKKNRKTATQADKLIVKIQQSLDQISGTKRIDSSKMLVDFGQLSSQLSTSSNTSATVKVANFFLMGKDIYAMDAQNGKIYKYNSNSGQTGVVASMVDNSKKLVAGTTVGDTVYLCTNQPMLYSYASATNQFNSIKLAEGNWSSATEITSYNGNLYFLDAASNQIWKYKKSDKGDFSKLPNFFEAKDTRSLQNSRRITIGGSIYVLTGDNTIGKFSAGLTDAFAFKGLPGFSAEIKHIDDIYASPSDKGGFYVMDSSNKRILVFDKVGQYTKQYIFNDLPTIERFFIDEANNQAYLLSNNKILRVSL